MTQFDTTELPGEVAKCLVCGSFEVKVIVGETSFCTSCYDKLDDDQDKEKERLLGILIELEDTLFVLKSGTTDVLSTRCLSDGLKIIEEGKTILRVGYTNEAKELADVSKEKD